jgi:hypothetical protein
MFRQPAGLTTIPGMAEVEASAVLWFYHHPASNVS